MKKAVIFDVDGVLVDSFKAWYEVSNYTLSHFGYPTLTIKKFKEKAWAKGLRNIMPLFFPNHSYGEVVMFIEKSYPRFISSISLLGDPKATFEMLEKKHIKLGIVTNTHTPIINLILKSSGLLDYPQSIVTANDVTNEKPHPEGLIKCLKNLRVNSQDAIFVGDTSYDYLAAKGADVFFVGYKQQPNKIMKLDSVLRYL